MLRKILEKISVTETLEISSLASDKRKLLSGGSLEIIKKIPKFWWILLAILIVGIFLRVWHHHDWLRFNADQGRDAQIVSDIVDGKTSLPLLGPKAGGTQFRLGPAFYWLETAATKIFGDAPDKMAYPDLVTGILCIPLLFFFLKKYFEKYTSLYLTAIFAVSAYAIFYARFGWNPNSTPFWTLLFLYAIHEVISEKNKRKYLWSALAGVAVGIDVQLHTTLLVILPVVTVLVFGYLAFKKKKILKYFLVILAMSLLINTPQLIDAYQKNGRNAKAFLRGLNTKQQAESTVFGNTVQGTSCWIQGNLYIISGYEISDTCTFNPAHSLGEIVGYFLGLIFVLGGTILGIRYFLKEKEADRKSFLGIVFIFVGVTYLIFLKMAFELSVRFYLPLIFLPYLTLGFWIRFFEEKFKVRQRTILLVLSVPLILSNLFFVQKSFATLSNYGSTNGGTVDVTILQEAETFSQFIVDNSKSEKKAYIFGEEEFLHKAYRPIKYLVGRSNVSLLLAKKKNPLPNRYFHIIRTNSKEKFAADPKIKILEAKTFGKFTLLLVQII